MALTEEQLLAHIENENVPVDELTEEFDALCADGKEVRAFEWADLLKDSLVNQKKFDEAVAVYQWIAIKRKTSPATAQKELLQILSTSRKQQKFISPAFEKAITIEQGFKRLNHLRSMKRKMLCYNKTWGFGIISRVDPFYQKIEIDFEKKGYHEFAFSYAAEALEALKDDHLLTIRHKEPERFEKLLKEEQAEAIRITLRSYGKLSITKIEEIFVPDMLKESEWKKFWAAARKELKKDPLIEIPTKRSEPLRIRSKAKTYDEDLFQAFKSERDVQTIFNKIEGVQAQNFNELAPFMKESIANRLAFAIKGGALNKPEWIAQALVYAEQTGVVPEGVDTSAELGALAKRNDLPAILETLPARFMQAFIRQLFTESESAKAFLLSRLNDFGTTTLNETIDVLINNGAEDDLSKQVLTAVRRRACSPALLLWILRNDERAAKWGISDISDLAFQTIEMIEQDNHSGGALRAQNQLREQIENVGHLKIVLNAMSESSKRDFLRRITDSPAWSKLDRQSLQAKIIKLCPKLHEVILKKTAAPTKEKTPRITSERSYYAKKDQFEHLLKKEIPENSKEIEVARSYGDLRENAEFKYAKEKQRLLGLQAEELQTALDTVKPTSFAGFPTDVVGMATGVELEYSDGNKETYYILGEWDKDEGLNIISSKTGMAKALSGAKPGEKVMVPTASGDKTEVTVANVLPLPENITAWIKG